MNEQKDMSDLFHLGKHASHSRHKPDFRSDFRTKELSVGDHYTNVAPYNHILFLKEGQLLIHCNEFSNREMNSNECILISKSSRFSIEVQEAACLMVFSFDVLRDVYDKMMMQSFLSIRSEFTYTFSPLPMCPQLTAFVDLMVEYLKRGINSEHLYEIKEKEFFLLLREFYSKENVVALLYPIIGISDFKSFILANYQKVESVAELADLSMMGRTAFDSRFREEFDMSPRQWMLKQMAKQIRYRAMDPDITIKNIMEEFKFNSATHFNKFCKQQFNCTPGQLLRITRLKR